MYVQTKVCPPISGHSGLRPETCLEDGDTLGMSIQ
jgi:hypothetical protein